jgi:hypothetical protein
LRDTLNFSDGLKFLQWVLSVLNGFFDGLLSFFSVVKYSTQYAHCIEPVSKVMYIGMDIYIKTYLGRNMREGSDACANDCDVLRPIKNLRRA